MERSTACACQLAYTNKIRMLQSFGYYRKLTGRCVESARIRFMQIVQYA